MKAIEVIRRAYELIKNPRHWTQNAYARDRHGSLVSPTNDAAHQWCAIGALEAVAGDASFAATCLLQRVSEEMHNGDHVQVLNDGHRPGTRTPPEAHLVVLGVYERCLEKYKDDPPLEAFVPESVRRVHPKYASTEFAQKYQELLALRAPLVRPPGR